MEKITYIILYTEEHIMDFKEFQSNIDIIESAEELQGWEFDRMLTTLQNVVINLDKIQKHVDNGIDNITKIIQ